MARKVQIHKANTLRLFIFSLSYSDICKWLSLNLHDALPDCHFTSDLTCESLASAIVTILLRLFYCTGHVVLIHPQCVISVLSVETERSVSLQFSNVLSCFLKS